MNKACGNCDHYNVCGIKHHPGDECSQWSGWISVKDELPKPYHTVLVEVFGADILKEIEKDVSKDSKKNLSEAYSTAIGSVNNKGEWLMFGMPMNPNPRYWREYPLFTVIGDEYGEIFTRSYS